MLQLTTSLSGRQLGRCGLQDIIWGGGMYLAGFIFCCFLVHSNNVMGIGVPGGYHMGTTLMGWVYQVGTTLMGWVYQVGTTLMGWVYQAGTTLMGWVYQAGTTLMGWVYQAGTTLMGWVYQAGTTLMGCGYHITPLSYSLQETYEQKRLEHVREMQAKEERMRQMFVQKVRGGSAA